MSNSLSEIKFSENLRTILERSEFKGKRKKLANMLDVSEATVSHWVAGRSQPTLEKLVSLAGILRVSLDFLVYGKHKNPQGQGLEVSSETQNDLSIRNIAQLIDVTKTKQNLVSTVSRELYKKIDSEVEKAAISQNPPGILSANDERILERCSSRVDIISAMGRHLSAELGEESDSGYLLDTVRDNLLSGISYRYIFCDYTQSWRPKVNEFRQLLADSGASREMLLKSVEFYWLKNPLPSGVTILYLDLAKLKKTDPLLLDQYSHEIRSDGLAVYIPLYSRTRPTAGWLLEDVYRDGVEKRYSEFLKDDSIVEV